MAGKKAERIKGAGGCNREESNRKSCLLPFLCRSIDAIGGRVSTVLSRRFQATCFLLECLSPFTDLDHILRNLLQNRDIGMGSRHKILDILKIRLHIVI